MRADPGRAGGCIAGRPGRRVLAASLVKLALPVSCGQGSPVARCVTHEHRSQSARSRLSVVFPSLPHPCARAMLSMANHPCASPLCRCQCQCQCLYLCQRFTPTDTRVHTHACVWYGMCMAGACSCATPLPMPMPTLTFIVPRVSSGAETGLPPTNGATHNVTVTITNTVNNITINNINIITSKPPTKSPDAKSAPQAPYPGPVPPAPAASAPQPPSARPPLESILMDAPPDVDTVGARRNVDDPMLSFAAPPVESLLGAVNLPPDGPAVQPLPLTEPAASESGLIVDPALLPHAPLNFDACSPAPSPH